MLTALLKSVTLKKQARLHRLRRPTWTASTPPMVPEPAVHMVSCRDTGLKVLGITTMKGITLPPIVHTMTTCGTSTCLTMVVQAVAMLEGHRTPCRLHRGTPESITDV